MMEYELRTKLLSDATIAAILATRLYPVILPQNTIFPAATYQIIDTPRDFNLDGPSGLARPKIQYTLWATKADNVKALARAIRLALNGFKGTLPDGSDVKSVMLEDERETYESDVNLHRIDLDFVVWFDETSATDN